MTNVDERKRRVRIIYASPFPAQITRFQRKVWPKEIARRFTPT